MASSNDETVLKIKLMTNFEIPTGVFESFGVVLSNLRQYQAANKEGSDQ